jgi:hypothetical protein
MENQHTVLEQKRKLNLGKEQSNYGCKKEDGSYAARSQTTWYTSSSATTYTKASTWTTNTSSYAKESTKLKFASRPASKSKTSASGS